MSTKLEPLIAPERPPEDAVKVGVTPDGLRTLWKREKMKVRVEPVFDEKGERVWMRNKNGDPVVPRNKGTRYIETQIFYTEPGLNNERYEVPYVEPTEAELRMKERERLVKELGGGKLAEMIVDSALKAGKTPDEIVMQMLAAPTQPVQVGNADLTAADLSALRPNDGTPQKPDKLVHNGGPNFTLGNGQKFRGTKVEAEAKQAELVAAYEKAMDDDLILSD
jgi:hypothetical protein